jgi:hypothetical protein
MHRQAAPIEHAVHSLILSRCRHVGHDFAVAGIHREGDLNQLAAPAPKEEGL